MTSGHIFICPTAFVSKSNVVSMNSTSKMKLPIGPTSIEVALDWRSHARSTLMLRGIQGEYLAKLVRDYIHI